jgi:hypothetical protein
MHSNNKQEISINSRLLGRVPVYLDPNVSSIRDLKILALLCQNSDFYFAPFTLQLVWIAMI